jgi:hypothetical protein
MLIATKLALTTTIAFAVGAATFLIVSNDADRIPVRSRLLYGRIRDGTDEGQRPCRPSLSCSGELTL